MLYKYPDFASIKKNVLFSAAFAIIFVTIITDVLTPVFAVDSILRSEELVYFPGESLVIYGKSNPNDVLITRIYDPTGRAIRIDDVQTDGDGFFRKILFTWPEPTKNLAYGVYTVQTTSSKNTNMQIEVTFAEGSEEEANASPRIPKTHILGVKMDTPGQISVGQSFRIFVQVTFDGALVDSDNSDLLGASHIHSGRGNSTLNVRDFIKLHEGLYYADVVLETEGTYIIHAAAFYRGYVSHDSRVVSASLTTINTVQDSVNRLETRLNSTNHELENLEARLDETQSALGASEASIKESLEEASQSIKKDIEAATSTVENLEDASGQINSIILPVLALISVIIALQISLFARIRASYR